MGKLRDYFVTLRRVFILGELQRDGFFAYLVDWIFDILVSTIFITSNGVLVIELSFR